MEAGRTLERDQDTHTAPLGWSRSLSILNSLRAVWWLFTNVRFAIGLMALLCGVSLLGVLIPQVPLAIRGNPAAEAAWLDSKGDFFGFLVDPMNRIGLFNVFHQGWFALLLALTAVSTGAYVVSRSSGVWQTIAHPRQRVPDAYFHTAPTRLESASPISAPKLAALLGRSHYRVETFAERDATYLFSDRFAWAQLGTLLTHIAVIIFLFAAIVREVDAFSSPLFLAEGSTLPVFPVRDANQLQVELLDAHGAFAPSGQALDYSSDLVIYRRGEEVKRCQSTVNSPCTYGGYRFHQSQYFGFGALLQVRNVATDNIVYRETLALSDTTPSPHVIIKDASGQTLLDESLVLTQSLDTGEVVYKGALVELPDGRALTIGLTNLPSGGKQRLVVLEPRTSADAVRLSLAEGATATAAGLQISYVSTSAIPSITSPDLPLPPGKAAAPTKLQLSNVIYGTATTSEGNGVIQPVEGAVPHLTIVGLSPQPAVLAEGQSITVAGYEYTFIGQREFAGITVKRDRSSWLIWLAAVMIVVGLTVTFWVPRRRLWAKITATTTNLAGQAPSHANYSRELRRLARDAGATVPEDIEDDD